MTVRVKAPDGSVVNFPAGTSDATIEHVMRQNYPPPARRGTSRNFFTEATQALNEVNRSIPFADEIAAGAGAISDVVQGRSRNLGQAFAGQRQQQNAMSQDFNARRPNVAAFNRGLGNAATMVVPSSAALPAASGAVNMARGATAALASSGVAAAADRGTAGERLAATSRAVNPFTNPLAAGLGVAGGRLQPRLPSSRARVSEPARALVREGVQLTPGQALGGTAKRMEDIATSTPIMGQAITNARERGVESLNRAATKRALRPIGGNLADDVATGNEAIASTASQFSRRYEDIVPQGGMSTRDPELDQTLASLQNITADMTDQAKEQLASIVRERVTKRIENGIIDGRSFKRIEADLTQKAGQFTKSQDPNQQDIGRGLQEVLSGLRESLARQNPQYAKALADTNKGYSRLATLETAAGRAGNVGGIATPKQLREAYRAGDKSVRRRATAQGRRPDQAFYDAAADVLPSNVGDSGTAGRLANNPLALGGMGALAVSNPAIGVPAVAGLAGGAAAYSKPAMDLFNKALASNVSKIDKQIALEQLGRLAVQNPQLRSLYDQAVLKSGIYAGQATQTNAMAVQ